MQKPFSRTGLFEGENIDVVTNLDANGRFAADGAKPFSWTNIVEGSSKLGASIVSSTWPIFPKNG